MRVQVDGILMSHPQVAEAVAFGCPDEKYGEIVAAAVVPNKPVQDTAAFAKDIQKQAGQKLAAFKVSLLCLLCVLCLLCATCWPHAFAEGILALCIVY